MAPTSRRQEHRNRSPSKGWCPHSRVRDGSRPRRHGPCDRHATGSTRRPRFRSVAGRRGRRRPATCDCVDCVEDIAATPTGAVAARRRVGGLATAGRDRDPAVVAVGPASIGRRRRRVADACATRWLAIRRRAAGSLERCAMSSLRWCATHCATRPSTAPTLLEPYSAGHGSGCRGCGCGPSVRSPRR